MGCFQQQIGWVPEKDQATMDAVGKVCDLPNFHAKIDSTNTKIKKYWRQFYRGNNFYNYNKKITIKIVTLVKLFVKAPWCRRCQHRTHRNRTPPH